MIKLKNRKILIINKKEWEKIKNLENSELFKKKKKESEKKNCIIQIRTRLKSKFKYL